MSAGVAGRAKLGASSFLATWVRASLLALVSFTLLALPAPRPRSSPSGWRVDLEGGAAWAKPPRRRRRKPRARAPEPASEAAAPALPSRGPTRIDFDERLVQGQTNQSGAVVLFARKASGLESMAERRKSFRGRTIRTVFDRPPVDGPRWNPR